MIGSRPGRKTGGVADVNEADYWVALEFRISRELAGMPDNHLRFLWCDGFIPERYLPDDPSPRITGRAWICNGPRQEEWPFTLFLNQPYGSPQEIEWQRLLPSENVTRWLAVDLPGKRIEVEPSAAVADSPEPSR
jgi:hypothetical protein